MQQQKKKNSQTTLNMTEFYIFSDKFTKEKIKLVVAMSSKQVHRISGWNLHRIYVLKSKGCYSFAEVYARENFFFPYSQKLMYAWWKNFANSSIR